MSPRTKEANQQIHEERREQILWAALKVFAKRGLAATKISDVAAAVRLSYGLIYHYFKTKDDIFIELVKRAFETSIGLFQYASQLDISPLEKFRIITEMSISGAYRGESVYYWNIVLQAHLSEAVPKKVVKIIEMKAPLVNEIFVPIIIEGQKLGQFVKDDPKELAEAFYSMLHGLAIKKMMVKYYENNIPVLPNADIVMRLLINPEFNEQIPTSKITINQFNSIQLIDKTLIYRRRDGSDADFTTYRSTAIQVLKDKNKVYQIESEDDAGEKIIALVNAENYRPILIEFQNPKENSISKIEYNNDIVIFNFPVRKLYQEVTLKGNYYDNYTLQLILRGFPFNSNEIIKFSLVLDGTGGTPIGPWEMEVRKIDTEKVQVPAGEFDCHKLEMGIGGFGISSETSYRSNFWYTVEEPRFLIKYEYKRMGQLVELINIE